MGEDTDCDVLEPKTLLQHCNYNQNRLIPHPTVMLQFASILFSLPSPEVQHTAQTPSKVLFSLADKGDHEEN